MKTATMETFKAGKGKILIASGREEDREALSAMLASQGYRVRSTPSGQAALEAIEAFSPDLILLGSHLPDVGSSELCRQLGSEDAAGDRPILWIEDGGAPQDLPTLLSAGAADCVARPFRPEEVQARIETHLQVRKLHTQLVELQSRLAEEVALREEAVQTLQEGEQAGRALVERLNEVLYDADQDGTLTYVSPAVERLLGYSPAEVVGHSVQEFIHPEDQASLAADLATIFAGQTAVNEYRVLARSGEVRWMHTSSQPVVVGGRVMGFQGILSDITERKLAEEQLQRQNEFLTDALESLTHPFYVVNADDYTIEIANSAARLEAAFGKATCYALTHQRSGPCSTADHPCPLEDVKRTRQPMTVEHIHHDAAGKPRQVEVHAYPLFDVEGKVTRVIEYSLDITDRKQAEEALRESEEKWRSLTEHSPDYIMLLDHEANILFANRTLPELSMAQVIGTSFYDYILPEYRRVTQECLEQVLRTGLRDRFESAYIDENGESLVFESHVGPVLRSGQVWGLTVRSADITERKRAEEALQRLSHDLGERVKELNSLYSISKLAGRRDITWAEILQETVKLLPPAFQYPEITCARISVADHEYRTPGFRQTGWRLGTDLIVYGERIGALEVYYLEPRSEQDHDPFLDEERELVAAVAERLGRNAERSQAEEALRESEARWRSVSENSPDHVVLLDTDLNIRYVNYPSPGLSVSQLIGTPLYAYVQEERQSEIKRILEGVLETGKPISYETEFVSPEAETIYYESRVVRRLLDDEVVGLAVNARDVTAYKRAEQALREAIEAAEQARCEEEARRQEAEQRRRVAESLAGVVAVLNSNESLERVLGFIAEQAGQLLDSQGIAIYRLEDAPGPPDLQVAEGLTAGPGTAGQALLVQRALQQAVATGQPITIADIAASPVEADHAASASQPGPCRSLLALPILTQGQAYGGIVLSYEERRTFSEDEVELATVFSEQVALAVENARLRDEVRQAAAAAERSRLARDLHDSVTQALFSASLVAEVLPQVWRRDPGEAEEGLEELRLLTRGALAEMRALLLELRPTTLVETPLNDLLWQLTEGVTSRAQLEIRWDLEPVPTLPPHVHVTFYRVAQEALHNVAKHAGARQLSVSLRASPPLPDPPDANWHGLVILHVSDDGCGFDPSRTEADQFGLSIMRERAEAVGATLSLQSEPGRGTQVTLVWQPA